MALNLAGTILVATDGVLAVNGKERPGDGTLAAKKSLGDGALAVKERPGVNVIKLFFFVTDIEAN
jgi:hypothetical protein